jgi:hypothetical protein
MAKYSKRSQEKVEKVMHEFKEGKQELYPLIFCLQVSM